MRMDNETFRLKVENLLGNVGSPETGVYDRVVMAELERLAKTPKKSRYFLKAVSSHPDPKLQDHFYRFVMRQVRTEQETAELERHVRHMFYEDRENAKATLARVAVKDAMPAFFRVISFTEEGWLAGELIRIVLAAPVSELLEPLADALASKDYLIQCLAIYLIGKKGEDEPLHLLAKFYRSPVGEKIDRLERKSLDALIEGGRAASDELILRWLKDKSARVRDVGLTLAQERRLVSAAGEIAGLVLIDPKTRAKAAATLLGLEAEEGLVIHPDHPSSAPIAKLIQSAKPEPLAATIRSLMRDESPAVREVAVRLVRFLPHAEGLSAQLRRLAVEDRASGVQIAALHVLADVDRERIVPTLVEVFTDVNAAVAGGREVVDAARALMHERLDPEAIEEVEAGIKAREEQRDAALDRFAGSVEWWRHDL